MIKRYISINRTKVLVKNFALVALVDYEYNRDMPSILPTPALRPQRGASVLRTRRERRLAKQRASSSRMRGTLLSVGMVFSLVLAALIILGAFAYADITRELPSVEILPRLLNPPDGLLLEPTRIYDRTGLQLLFTFSPAGATQPRRYIPIKHEAFHLRPSIAGALDLDLGRRARCGAAAGARRRAGTAGGRVRGELGDENDG